MKNYLKKKRYFFINIYDKINCTIMKTRKNIRDAFEYNGGGTSKSAELETAEITSLTTYSNDINDFYVYYTYSGTKRISFSDGEEVVV